MKAKLIGGFVIALMSAMERLQMGDDFGGALAVGALMFPTGVLIGYMIQESCKLPPLPASGRNGNGI